MFIVLELGVTFVVLEYLALLEDSIRNNLIVTDWMVSYFLSTYGFILLQRFLNYSAICVDWVRDDLTVIHSDSFICYLIH